MSDITFLYTVNPRRTIIGLSGSTKVIRTNKSLYLTKEDVILCLRNASVYRRFANEGINERVTIDNVDRVHREKYIPENEWEDFLAAEKSKEHGTVTVPPVNDSNHLADQKNNVIDEVDHSNPTGEGKSDTGVDDTNNTVVESDDDLEIEKLPASK